MSVIEDVMNARDVAYRKLDALREERDQLKAKLESCHSPIMTHDEKIMYWERKYNKVQEECDQLKAAYESAMKEKP